MNILYFSTKKRWGGVVTWMKKTAHGLEAKGYKVFIISHPNCKIVEDKDLNVVKLKPGFEFNPFTIFKLVYFIKKNKIDLIVTNIRKEVSFGGIAAKICGIPNVRRIGTDTDFDNKNGKYYSLVDYVISPCQQMIDSVLVKHKYLSNLPMICIYNGRNLLDFNEDDRKTLRKDYKISDNSFVLGVNCQLIKIKNVDGIINVFKKVVNKHPNVVLVIAGTGNLESLLRRRVEDDNLRNSCFILGHTKDAFKLPLIYDISILFSNAEGFSNSVVEYMAASSPVICTDVGGQKEIVINGETGFLIERENEDMLYDRVSELIENPQLREKFVENSRKLMKEKFSEDIMIDKLEKLYGDLSK
ncbi:MAG: glycosyltransferase family 4 protein [Candidatus Delongbacteria bacterium]|nr:glycosyltransferase family 4 protein [Candidatus Delongbacteria bacterium]MBN2835372.1 glycosyltransferase family 4 protein [Candidatus Delongbacteria bacterium]